MIVTCATCGWTGDDSDLLCTEEDEAAIDPDFEYAPIPTKREVKARAAVTKSRKRRPAAVSIL